MDKSVFINELKELMAMMTEEEIEKTINALSDCRPAIYKNDNNEKGEKSRLLSTIERHEAELSYVGEKRKKGTVKIAGASLLTRPDFYVFRKKLPTTSDKWWLFDKHFVIKDNEFVAYTSERGKIRPVLIIEDIKGKLEPGETFYINDERFQLLMPSLAIKTVCLKGECTYPEMNYERSTIKFCVDGWYFNLIKENKTQKQQDENGAQPERKNN